MDDFEGLFLSASRSIGRPGSPHLTTGARSLVQVLHRSHDRLSPLIAPLADYRPIARIADIDPKPFLLIPSHFSDFRDEHAL